MSEHESQPGSFQFQGFQRPNYTPVPDEVFDRLLPELRGAELKALLYIIRRTFGFKKDRDAISFNQFLRGIRTRDGKIIDRGCGVRDRTTLSKALRALEHKNVIVSFKGVDERGEKEINEYALRFATSIPEMGGVGLVEGDDVVGTAHYRTRGTLREVVGKSDYRSMESRPTVVGQSYPQETVSQETALQETQHQHTEVEEVVAALSAVGMTRKVARDLASRYPLSRIRAQVDMLDRRPAKDPVAVLVRAIKEDWAPPPGYETPEQRRARATEDTCRAAATELLAEQQRLLRSTWRARTILQFGIEPEVMDLWDRAQRLLVRFLGTSTHRQLFADSLIVVTNHHEVQVILPERWQKVQAKPEHRTAVEQALCAVLKRSVRVELVHVS